MASFSIRKTIPILIVTPLVVALSFVSSLSIYYGRRSVNQLSGDLMQTTTDRIQEQVISLMQETLLINRLNASAIHVGELALPQRSEWGSYFASQVDVTTATHYIYFGNEQGYFVGSRKLDGERFIVLSDENSQGLTYQYEVNASGEPAPDPVRDFDYDPRQRAWYQAAIAAQKPIWSDVYVGATAQELLITAAHPIYDSQNQLIGVLGADMFIREINQFLESLEIARTGEVFIVEPNGLLVASSVGETVDPSTDANSDDDGRISAFESSETLIVDATNQILEEFGDLSIMQDNIRITHRVDGQHTFISARPFGSDLGLEWLIVVVIPTQDFTGPLRAQTWIIFIFALVVLAIAIGLGWLVARWIAAPILRLHTAAVDVKSQTFVPSDIEPLTERDDEIGQFAGVFSEMAEIIGEREESMEEQLKYLRLRAPLPDVRRSLDLSELRSLQQRAKTIRDAQQRR